MFRSLNARKWFFGVLEIETHTINLERILDRVAPSPVVFMIVLLEQVQSIDYSGDEVQVTITDGTGCTAQKVGTRISLGAARGLGGLGKPCFPPRSLPLATCLEPCLSPEELPTCTQSCVDLQI